MAHGFRRSRAGIVARLSDPETDVLASLFTQTADLLQHEAGSPQRPADPAAGTSDTGEMDEFEAIMSRAGLGAEDDALEHIEDPAVRRLLPDAHRDDPQVAADFRRMTGAAVRDRKLGHLRRAAEVVSSAQGRLVLTEEDARSLLIAMTDVRLVLADRLGLDSDEAADALSGEVEHMDEDDPLFGAALGYEFLTWLQETLAVALMPS